ncbi:hypothetical protein N0V88_007274 [Collariella sp. IMI 366227]|nr:hypothetical protein N0V88_007274 [Collariella sp. IMI 366227]
MKATRTPALRAALRPSLRQTPRVQPAQTRFATTGPGSPPPVGDKGTAKVYNKDGTNPNKNLVYIGAGALGLGAMYVMYSGKGEKVVEKTKEKTR